jgi:biopolymer transport protein ExbD
MNFKPEVRREQTESIVPMINVVFLLLIFFLMTSEIAQPEPFPVAPPAAASEEQADGIFTLFVNPKGEIAYQSITGEEAALASLKLELEQYCIEGRCSEDTLLPPVLLRADANAPANIIARLMPKLGEIGFKETHLITAVLVGDDE